MVLLLPNANPLDTCGTPSSWSGMPPQQDGYYWYRDIPDDIPDIILLDHGWGYVPGVAFPVPVSALFGWWQSVVGPA